MVRRKLPPHRSNTITIPKAAPSYGRTKKPTGVDAYPVPDELGKSAFSLATRCAEHGFFRTVCDVRGRNELLTLNSSEHPAADLLANLATHGAPVQTENILTPTQLEAAVKYGCHGSAMRDVEFVRTELTEQSTFGHIMVLQWSAAKGLPNLWISPIGLIPQEARRPRLIYDYIFSGLNNATVRQAPS